MVDRSDRRLIAWYKLDGSVYDEISKTDGTATNITYVSGGAKNGSVNEAASFNGTSSKVNASLTSNIATSGLTLSGWVYLPTDTGTGDLTIVSVGDNTNQMSLRFTKRTTPSVSNDGTRIAAIGMDDTFSSGNLAPPDTAKWYHCAATWDGTNFRTYLNGVLELSDTSALSTWDGAITEISIGTAASGPESFQDAYLSDVRVYNRVLTEAEVRYIMHGFGYSK